MMARPTHFFRRHLTDKLLAAGVIVIVAAIGVYTLTFSRAATPVASVEAESGTIAGAASSLADSTASGTHAVKFGTSSGTGTGTVTPLSNIDCNFQIDTWSGDAASVGYTATKLSGSDGNPASFSVKLNANPGTTEVVGYPSDQCILYSAIPANFGSAFNTTPPANSSGLDYEFAYDIWLTTAARAQSNNWNTDLELMIWTYNHGQLPLGSIKATLSDGSKAWVDGNNTTGTVSVVLPSDTTSGVVNISSIVSQLQAFGYVSSTYNGILSAEYGIEAPYGGNQTFTVNSLSMGTLH
jgi:hypothetical protein